MSLPPQVPHRVKETQKLGIATRGELLREIVPST
jgi:hypothetical protein